MPETTRPVAAIDEDLACMSCDYNLRGLSPEGRCPECGAEVAPSIAAAREKSRPLHLANRRWLATITAGACCMAAAGLNVHASTSFLIAAIRGIPYFYYSHLGWAAATWHVLILAAIVMLTVREPHAKTRPERSRVLLRVFGIVAAISALVPILIGGSSGTLAGARAIADAGLIVRGLAAIAPFVGMATGAVLYWHLRRILARLPKHRHAAEAMLFVFLVPMVTASLFIAPRELIVTRLVSLGVEWIYYKGSSAGFGASPGFTAIFLLATSGSAIVQSIDLRAWAFIAAGAVSIWLVGFWVSVSAELLKALFRNRRRHAEFLATDGAPMNTDKNKT